ncbi:MAG: DUF2201 family putative metallopeptidase [Pseudomonadota bacterium]
METMASCSTEPQEIMTPLAQKELVKWQADREHWEASLPIMSFLSQCLKLTPVTSANMGFASTDGRNLYFCPTYSAALTDEERIFLQAHLIWHCVAGHLAAPLVGSTHRWHLACDHEVNSLLLTLGISLPSQAHLFPACFGFSAMRVYRWLAGHPRLNEEICLDIHPAAMWEHSHACVPDMGLTALWRRRAHVAAKEEPALPRMVADFCATR